LLKTGAHIKGIYAIYLYIRYFDYVYILDEQLTD